MMAQGQRNDIAILSQASEITSFLQAARLYQGVGGIHSGIKGLDEIPSTARQSGLGSDQALRSAPVL
jgi:hypothetical protein